MTVYWGGALEALAPVHLPYFTQMHCAQFVQRVVVQLPDDYFAGEAAASAAAASKTAPSRQVPSRRAVPPVVFDPSQGEGWMRCVCPHTR